MEALKPYMTQIYPMATSLLQCLLILIVGWIAAGGVQRALVKHLENKRKLDRSLSRFCGNAARYLVLAGAVIAALGTVGVETTSFVALLGSVGLAVGLALQGNLSHFASGVMLLFFRPFEDGDVVTAGGHTGKVDHIGIFATTLYTPDNQKIILPNSIVTSGSIVNITPEGIRRCVINVGVAYGSDIDEIVKILTTAASKADMVLSEPGVGAAFVGMGASSVDFIVFGWCKADDFAGVIHSLHTESYNALNAAGIDIPYPQMVTHQAPQPE